LTKQILKKDYNIVHTLLKMLLTTNFFTCKDSIQSHFEAIFESKRINCSTRTNILLSWYGRKHNSRSSVLEKCMWYL